MKLPTFFYTLARIQSRQEWLFLFTSVGLILGICISLPAWSGIRTYPLSPVFPGFMLPAWTHTMLITTVIVSVGASIFYKKQRGVLLACTLISLLVLSVLDITRFQPWVFHYSAVLGLFMLYQWRLASTTKLLDAAGILVSGIYFWSGVQKMNWAFMSEMFPWFTQPIWEIAPTLLLAPFLTLGLLVPFIELTIGLGLLFKSLRNIAILGAAGMLLIVLVCLGPLGHNWNMVVWPWNIAMFLMVMTLFFKVDWSFGDFFKRQQKNYLGWVAFGIFWLLPLGNVFGSVDHYLSWSLYSGRPVEATLTASPLILAALSENTEDNTLPFLQWSIEELNIVSYPEERAFIGIFQNLCDTYNNSPTLQLEIEKSISYFQNDRMTYTESCGSLKK